ncbi:hypothetical protein [Myroides marinus]|uniref:hypothetical protein n=1 Tax=Myroides marinus TaxID=703342 RepID=UPI002574A08B|nr:hypothetical protein [Myroides marinus]
MKIVQYFLLLFLLALVSLFVFILTQSPEYKIERKFSVDAPKELVYNYINDLDNWTDWMKSSKENNGTYNIELENLGTYSIRPEYSHPYDSLSQDILNDNKISNIIWRLKGNQNKTNITFTFSGTLDFKTKFITFFKGTPNQVATNSLDKNIDAFIVYFIKQYKEYEVKLDAVKTTPSMQYLYLETSSSIGMLNEDLKTLNNELSKFCETNQIEIAGDPFLILDNNRTQDIFKYKFALPIKGHIFLNEEEKYKIDTLAKQSYFESTLSGYYTFLPDALRKTRSEINNRELNVIADQPIILLLKKSVIDSRLAAEWETVIKIPVEQQIIPVTTPVYTPTHSNTASGTINSDTSTENTTTEEPIAPAL